MTTIKKQQEVLEQFVEELSPAIHGKWYLVGGALVNWCLLDRPAKDLDILVPVGFGVDAMDDAVNLFLGSQNAEKHQITIVSDLVQYAAGEIVMEIPYENETVQIIFAYGKDMQDISYKFPIPVTRMWQDLTLPPDDRTLWFGNLDPGASALYRGNVITIPYGTKPEYAQRYIDKFAGTKYTVVVEDTPF